MIGEEGTRGSIVHQAVFLADMTQLDRCRQIMREFYGPELPATSYIPQPPCGGKLLAIEALGVGQGLGEVQIERVSEELVIARHNGIAWVHCTKTVPQPTTDPSMSEPWRPGGCVQDLRPCQRPLRPGDSHVVLLGGSSRRRAGQATRNSTVQGPTSSATFVSSTVVPPPGSNGRSIRRVPASARLAAASC